ncbi:MAG: putative metalloprotease [Paracoccaceae bacterium]|jgi:putative metalloprotease
MLKFIPILLPIFYGLAIYHFSAWRTAKKLTQESTDLAEPKLLSITKNMAKALDVARIKVRIYEVDPINGLAAADGQIFLTRGFLKAYVDDRVSADELAGVIAHELGHVALGHAKRRMIDFTGQNAIVIMASTLLSRFLPGIGVIIARKLLGMGTGLMAARLSQRDEYEADAYAAALMVKAGLGTTPLKSLFAKLSNLTGQTHQGPAWGISHPKPQDRISAIEALESKWTSG